MFQFTRLMLTVLGISAIVIGLMIFLIGPHSTANLFGNIFTSVVGSTGYSGGLHNANIDSEMRFYSVFWMAYGVSLIWLASNIVQFRIWVFAGLGMFFLGGVGRLISFVIAGAPDPLFVTLMAIELVGPTIITAVFAAACRRTPFGQ